MQLPLWTPPSDWRPPQLHELPQNWANFKRVGLDIETKDPQLKKLGPGIRRGAEIIGVSFAFEDVGKWYLPFGHGEDNMDKSTVLRYLRDQAKQFKGIVVGANLQYDLDFLAEQGIWYEKASCFRDIQIAEPLINELQDSYSLDAILERHGMPLKDESLMKSAAKQFGVDAKKEMYKLPARFVGPYAEWDAEAPLKLLRRQERIIEEQDLWGIFDLETAVLPVLIKMRRRGVRVDFKRLQDVEDWAMEEALEALKLVKAETGVSIDWKDVWKANVVAQPLYELGIEVPKTEKTKQPSVSQELLESIKHPVGDAIRRARKMNKVVTTFGASIRRHAIGDRIHCTFNQMRKVKDDDESADEGARYGRLSSSDPNMQQQPSRDPEIGPRWRSIYIPEDGMLWACNDFSQQEPRVLVHYAELCRFQGAKATADRYRNDPSTDNHTMMTEIIYGAATVQSWSKDVFKKYRSECKQIFLGKCYGMGGAKLCHNLGLPTEWIWSQRMGRMIEIAGSEGQAIIKQFDNGLPFVKMLAKRCEQEAKKKGYIITILGRRCRFPKMENGEFDWCHKALNRLIQGSSADQTKKAMVEIDAAGEEMQLQVHDEIDMSVRDYAHAQTVADIMTECVPMNVPFKVDVEIGPSWGEVKAAA